MRKKLSFLFTIIALFSNCILKNQKPFNLYKLNFKDSLVIDIVRHRFIIRLWLLMILLCSIKQVD